MVGLVHVSRSKKKKRIRNIFDWWKALKSWVYLNPSAFLLPAIGAAEDLRKNLSMKLEEQAQ